MVPIEMSTPHFYSTFIHTIGLGYVPPFSHNTQRGRQTDSVVGIGRLCSSVGGLQIVQHIGGLVPQVVRFSFLADVLCLALSLSLSLSA